MLHNTWILKLGHLLAKGSLLKAIRRLFHVQHYQTLLTCLYISDIFTVVGGLQLEVPVGGGGGLSAEHLVEAAGSEVVARAAVSSLLLLSKHNRALSWGVNFSQRDTESCVALELLKIQFPAVRRRMFIEAAKCRIADSTFCSFGNGGVILQDLRSAAWRFREIQLQNFCLFR